MADFDLAIVGGGINGAGIARDAAGRGLARAAGRAERPRLRHLVGLDQADPWRPALSRARLVPAGARGADRARGAAAHGAASDPADAVRAAGRARHAAGAGCCGSGCSSTTTSAAASSCRRPARIDLARDPLGAPLKGRYEHGFEYSDCWVDDARLVVLNARRRRRARRGDPHPHPLRARRARRRLAAGARGARPARRRDAPARWSMRPARGSARSARRVLQRPPPGDICGSSRAATSWCARLFDHDRGYIFQAPDGRVVFALPFERDFTLVGTTDQRFLRRSGQGRGRRAEEIAYLCEVANDHFRTAVSPADVVWSFAGVRPLYDDGSTQAAGHAARLCAGARPRRRRGAAAHGLWRQDHDLSPARRGGARQARAGVRRAAGLDQGHASAGRRFRRRRPRAACRRDCARPGRS